jgi:ribosome-associated translation inhibitor RaiA
MQIEIRSLNEKISPAQRAYIERRLFYALGRFGSRVRRVMVRLEDLNGPRGGLDKRCHIEARLSRRGLLVVDVRDAELEPAVSRAAERMSRRLRDELTMRRDQRKRGRSPSAQRSAA